MKRQDDRGSIRPSFNKKSGGEQESTESNPQDVPSTMRASATSSSGSLAPKVAKQWDPSNLAPFMPPQFPQWETDHPVIKEWATVHQSYLIRKQQNGLVGDEEWIEGLSHLMETPLSEGLHAWLVDLSIAHDPDGRRPFLILTLEHPFQGKALLIRPIIGGPLISGTVLWTCHEVGGSRLGEIWIGAVLAQRLYLDGVSDQK